jgi:hypothetical protein
MIANENITKHINRIKLDGSFLSIIPDLNFWSNFSINFKDETFVMKIIKDKEIKKKLIDIFQKIDVFISCLLESNSIMIKDNNIVNEIMLKFFHLHQNILESELNIILLNQNFQRHFFNFMSFYGVDLKKYRKRLFEVKGYSYLDFKGKFCKFILT